jgi:hypothetical protein
MILDKPEGIFIGADHIGTQALTLAFLAVIFFAQGIAASAKWTHDQFSLFDLGKKMVVFPLLRFFIVMRHTPRSPYRQGIKKAFGGLLAFKSIVYNIDRSISTFLTQYISP